MIRLVALELAGDLAAWRRAGFAFDDEGRCRVGTVELTLRPGVPGITGWAFDELADPVDGLPVCTPPVSAGPEVTHLGGVTHIDHVVVSTDDLDRTVAAFEAVGIPCKRIREATVGGRPIRQAFFRAGEVILEIVDQPSGPGAHLWGLAVVVGDVAETARTLGTEVIGDPRPAVQPGWQIASARRDLGLGVPLAYMSR